MWRFLWCNSSGGKVLVDAFFQSAGFRRILLASSRSMMSLWLQNDISAWFLPAAPASSGERTSMIHLEFGQGFLWTGWQAYKWAGHWSFYGPYLPTKNAVMNHISLGLGSRSRFPQVLPFPPWTFLQSQDLLATHRGVNHSNQAMDLTPTTSSFIAKKPSQHAWTSLFKLLPSILAICPSCASFAGIFWSKSTQSQSRLTSSPLSCRKLVMVLVSPGKI